MSASLRLPDGAPSSVRAFCEGRADRVTVDLDDLDWLWPPGEARPTVTLLPGSTDRTASFELRRGPGGVFRSVLEVAIVGGRLVVAVEGFSEEEQRTIDRWASALDRQLRDQDAELDSIRARDRSIAATRRRVPGRVAAGAGITVPLAAIGPAGARPVRSARRTMSRTALASLTAVALVVATIVALVLGVDGDEEATTAPSSGGPPVVSASSAPTTVAASTAAASPATASSAPAFQPTTTTPAPCGVLPAGSTPFRPGSWAPLDELPRCDAAPADGYATCDDRLLPCTAIVGPWYVAGGDLVGISHSGSVPDALTGAEGPSQATHLVRVLGPPPGAAVVTVTSRCGDRTLSGEAELDGDGEAAVAHPLFTFGPCRVTEGMLLTDLVSQRIDGSSFGFAGSFDVNAATVEPTFTSPWIDQLSLAQGAESGWLDAAATTLATLGASPLDPACITIVAPGAGPATPPQTCASAWTFRAAVAGPAGDGPLAHGAGFVGPATPATGPAGAISGPLFDASVYPCGAGHAGMTFCADGNPPMQASGLVVVSVALRGSATPDTEVDLRPSGGSVWRLTDGVVSRDGGPTRARAIWRSTSLTFVIPADELPSGALSYIVRTDGLDQPVSPVDGIVITPTVTALDTAPPDRAVVQAFYEEFAAAVRSGDTDFLLERLHPAVLTVYPTECPARLASFVDPDFTAEVVEVGATGGWEWQVPEGPTVIVDPATSVTVRLGGRSQTGEPVEAHVAMVDGTVRWFTFCA